MGHDEKHLCWYKSSRFRQAVLQQPPPNLRGNSMSYVIASDDNRFDYDVLNKNLVIVDFYASWCEPCKQMAPILEEVARDGYGDFSVVKIDIDENKYLSERYDIKSIPTLVLFVKGTEVARHTGATNKG